MNCLEEINSITNGVILEECEYIKMAVYERTAKYPVSDAAQHVYNYGDPTINPNYEGPSMKNTLKNGLSNLGVDISELAQAVKTGIGMESI